MEIEVGDKITIEGLNISPDGAMHFNKPKKTGVKKEAPVLVVTHSTKFVEKSAFKAAIGSLKDPQKIMNSAISEKINAAKFNSWFDNYSFKWVPDFCKSLIKGWVYAAWKEGKND